jgi:hypothetical protein
VRPTPPPGGPAAAELPKLETTFPDEAGAPVAPKFFTATQFATLRKLCEIMAPANKETGAPGALDAKAPEFLDFLIGESPADRQQLYRTGLDKLKGLDDSNAAKMLASLKQPWTYEAPRDPVAAFLRAAKQDIRTATQNSREWVKSPAAAGPGGRRGFGGMGLYWNSLD